MKIFISSEVQDADNDHAQSWSTVCLQVERKINELLQDGDYGDAIEKLAIIPNIFTDEALKAFGYEERRELYNLKKRSADYRLRININDYKRALTTGQFIGLLLPNIIECIKLLNNKLKQKKLNFNGEKLLEDIKSIAW